MNFLAHLHLSHDTPDHRLGNVAADFVKGSAVNRLRPTVYSGVRQHRAVDGFTDRHPMVQRSIARLSPTWGWFSGIIVDVYYDHILARTWERYAAESLRSFTERMNAELSEGAVAAGDDGEEFIRKLVANDDLWSYRTADGIGRSLLRVSGCVRERLRDRALLLENALPELLARDEEFQADFHAFYPDLRAFAAACPDVYEPKL